MLPQHRVTATMGMLPRQKYFFITDNPADQTGWNLALSTLFPEPAFHSVIESHGIKGVLASDWTITFQATDGVSHRNGPRYSRLCKALWDSFGPLFDECGVRLVNHHSGQAVPIKAGPRLY